MTLPRRLFVYGTLQPQAATRMGDWIAQRLVRCEPASAPGRLFAVRGGNGWFPALIPPSGQARVSGTLCWLDLEPGDLALLDRYEGREYRRVASPVRTASGLSEAGQLYLWRIALPDEAEAIAGGDFLAWLRRTGRRAFSTPRNGT
ncbi:gamma-glutamylcyclotransferase family protein [Novosphingobium malaysiense]|uniref:Putative gamma-glutamylcyclotransferase n=1 Tax=Novosphingobium malaysiense TaxID=1348853 RepID=A0A0B1ZT99_9SPHN|nr:gamma-glutamylcyclotransferase family protein [Novosphingobium malaysiense]KHK92352.1 hypothetical protein LK12_05920 [Novosphingobium malaysiense]